MLDLEPRVWRHPRRESFEAQRKKVIDFGSKWKSFDFTKNKSKESDSSSSSERDEKDWNDFWPFWFQNIKIA